MNEWVLFQMCEPFRQSLIKEQQFYLDQARKRLLSQFDDIEIDADRASEEWLEQHGNPARPDPGDIYEAAYDAGIDFYQLLSDMRDKTRLSIVAGMYHEWDKQLRDWMIREINLWHHSELMRNKIWAVNIRKLIDLLENIGWKVSSNEYYRKVDACRLVVNVYKHGDGSSLLDLNNRYPEYLTNPLDQLDCENYFDCDCLNHSHLSVTDNQLQEFSDAIVAFWKDVPENIIDRDEISIPEWFLKTVNESKEKESTA
ncbi:MAG: hypothetical protein KZQ92_22665 [Candidatus Thiodiazotropha sp. (ex Lucinoma borealis)]|nr:hypothetical protein [Candidatus Thiodiazotropha sp. (ex Lucinoma borealis)]